MIDLVWSRIFSPAPSSLLEAQDTPTGARLDSLAQHPPPDWWALRSWSYVPLQGHSGELTLTQVGDLPPLDLRPLQGACGRPWEESLELAGQILTLGVSLERQGIDLSSFRPHHLVQGPRGPLFHAALYWCENGNPFAPVPSARPDPSQVSPIFAGTLSQLLFDVDPSELRRLNALRDGATPRPGELWTIQTIQRMHSYVGESPVASFLHMWQNPRPVSLAEPLTGGSPMSAGCTLPWWNPPELPSWLQVPENLPWQRFRLWVDESHCAGLQGRIEAWMEDRGPLFWRLRGYALGPSIGSKTRLDLEMDSPAELCLSTLLQSKVRHPSVQAETLLAALAEAEVVYPPIGFISDWQVFCHQGKPLFAPVIDNGQVRPQHRYQSIDQFLADYTGSPDWAPGLLGAVRGGFQVRDLSHALDLVRGNSPAPLRPPFPDLHRIAASPARLEWLLRIDFQARSCASYPSLTQTAKFEREFDPTGLDLPSSSETLLRRELEGASQSGSYAKASGFLRRAIQQLFPNPPQPAQEIPVYNLKTGKKLLVPLHLWVQPVHHYFWALHGRALEIDDDTYLEARPGNYLPGADRREFQPVDCPDCSVRGHVCPLGLCYESGGKAKFSHPSGNSLFLPKYAPPQVLQAAQLLAQAWEVTLPPDLCSRPLMLFLPIEGDWIHDEFFSYALGIANTSLHYHAYSSHPDP